MKTLKDLLDEKLKEDDKKGYIKHEFQDYGYRLALALNDLRHKALYIKLAKENPRELMDEALMYTLEYPNPKSKGKIFMWKLKELKDEKKEDRKG